MLLQVIVLLSCSLSFPVPVVDFVVVSARLSQAKGFDADVAQCQPGGLAPAVSVAPVLFVLKA